MNHTPATLKVIDALEVVAREQHDTGNQLLARVVWKFSDALELEDEQALYNLLRRFLHDHEKETFPLRVG